MDRDSDEENREVEGKKKKSERRIVSDTDKRRFELKIWF